VDSEDDIADSMIAAGADIYVMKGGPSEELFNALFDNSKQ
jgi:hypothetical protein